MFYVTDQCDFSDCSAEWPAESVKTTILNGKNLINIQCTKHVSSIPHDRTTTYPLWLGEH